MEPESLLKARVKSFCKKSNLPTASGEVTLQAMLLKYGPVVVSFRATADAYFMSLKGRYNRKCPTTTARKRSGSGKSGVEEEVEVEVGITHTGLLVGYDRTHWIVKNSYGSGSWGIEGYLYVKRTVALSCGMIGPGSFAMIPFL